MLTSPPNAANCLKVVRQLIKTHDWQVLEEADFVQQVQARAIAVNDEALLTKIAVNLYCEVLHAACSSHGNRQQQAYVEISRYLYDHALHKYRDPEMARDITHDAVILIHEQLSNCQNPGAFLAFALLKLWNAATTYFRRRDREQQRILALSDDRDDDYGYELADTTTLTPEVAALTADMTSTLITRMADLIRNSPRAEKQFKAVLFKFLYGYRDEEIAEALDTDVAGVHVLRSRGIKRLREDSVLRQLAEEMDL